MLIESRHFLFTVLIALQVHEQSKCETNSYEANSRHHRSHPGVHLDVCRVPLLGHIRKLVSLVFDAPLDGGASRQLVVDDVVAPASVEMLAAVRLAVVLLQSLNL